ncbi:hypothetical protein [Amycolatopsis balhimycina]|uniref:hypothetical protein n=1 Tax=Amycolatopsis balhimycina TaxID=208443 RepID=UPI000F79B04D|nr:hypothetical protein [Amycolatopsis balhimycina]
MIEFLSRLNWGNVPAWAGALSLILAFRIFLRDRKNSDRRHVDQLGIWFTSEYKPVAPWRVDPVEDVRVVAHVRNASETPIEVAKLAYEVSTEWSVADRTQWTPPTEYEEFEGPGVWTPEPGLNPAKLFPGDFVVPPGETLDIPVVLSVRNMVPVDALQLSFFGGVKCRTLWVLAIDNSGRRWRLNPSQGLARPIGRLTRRRDFYPKGWGHDVTIVSARELFLKSWFGSDR